MDEIYCKNFTVDNDVCIVLIHENKKCFVKRGFSGVVSFVKTQHFFFVNI